MEKPTPHRIAHVIAWSTVSMSFSGMLFSGMLFSGIDVKRYISNGILGIQKRVFSTRMLGEGWMGEVGKKLV